MTVINPCASSNSPNSSDQFSLHMQKRYHKAFIQLGRIHLPQFFVIAAVTAATSHRRIKRSRSVNSAPVFRMNPRFLSQVSIEAMLFLFETETIFLFALLQAEFVLNILKLN